MSKLAVLLLAHGSPEHTADIPEYLRNVTGGHPLPAAAVAEVVRRYQLIGRSPLTEHTRRLASLVARELGVAVYVGMRNWQPYIRATVAQMAAEGITHAVAICLAPQNSRTSVGQYCRSLEQALTAAAGKPTLEFVEDWHAEAGLIAAFAERLRQADAAAGTAIPVLFTAHSVPQRTIAAGDDYAQQAHETAALVAQAVPEIAGHWRLAFQSQGMRGGDWLGPTVESVIDEAAAAGEKFLLIQPIGFVCDHVEILYDIDIAFTQYAAERGIALRRTASLNDSPTFVRAVADLARRRLGL